MDIEERVKRLYEEGVSFFQQNNPNDALKKFDEILRIGQGNLNPGAEIDVYFGRGLVLYMLGRKGEAKECSDHILSMKSNSSHGVYIKNLSTDRPLFEGISDPEFFTAWLEGVARM